MGKFIAYHDGDQKLEGYLAVPLASPVTGGVFPGVLIAPTWLNVNAGIRKRADRLAERGYAAFVLDTLGAGVLPAPPQHPAEVVLPFMCDRLSYRRRLLAGLEAFALQPECDAENMAAIGYCFGGCGVLELARSGALLKGVISLHGDLSSPLPTRPGAIKAKILVLHDDADPLGPFESVMEFREEMRGAGANWELDIYGGAKHGFTGEGVIGDTMPEAALHQQAETRSWRTTLEFLKEVLG